jgi:phosphoserine phosphatase RsbU/P
MNRTCVQLLLRLTLCYAAALAIGTVTLTWIYNMLINGSSLNTLLKFNLKAILVGDALMLLLLACISWIRLRKAASYWETPHEEERAATALRCMYRFPGELFWGMLGLSLVFSLLYDLASLLYEGQSPFSVSSEKALQLLESLLKEMTLAATLAMLLYIFSRSSLQPYIIALQQASPALTELIQHRRSRSFLHPFMLTFGICFFIMLFSILNYVHTKSIRGKEPLLREIGTIAAYYCVMGGTLLSMHALAFRRELRTIISSFKVALTSSESMRAAQRLPVLAEDELGLLAAAVNGFRTRMRAEYNHLQQELQLASVVQRKLMPPAFYAAGDMEISAHCRQSQEVGGDLYDIVPIDERRVAVINGDVSGKGLSAALVMSAAMVLFRAEVRNGGSASEMMTRLNRMMTETLQGEMFVTLGIAVMDCLTGRLEYASAGHMAPYLLHNGSVQLIDCSSLPIGIDEEIVYDHRTLDLLPGGRLVLYTDGVIEEMNDQGKMLGFEGFESILGQLPHDKPLQEQLNTLTAPLVQLRVGSHEDDWTVVMIGRKASPIG